MFLRKKKLLTPKQLKSKFALSSQTQKIIENTRTELKNIISGKSDKLLVIIGPCSISDEKSICEYAQKLLKIYEQVHKKIFIALRMFTAKPRTNLNNYKGLIHQPNPLEDENLYNGIIAQRKIILKVIELSGFAIADELLYPEIFNYTDDLISYYVLGARTCNSQPHKLFSSGIDIPIGIKNSLSGNLFENIKAIQNPHKLFLDGWETETSGNIFAHAILRGTINNPNYHYENLMHTIQNYPPVKNKFIAVDTNHANSNKNPFEQSRIIKEILLNRSQNKLIGKHVRGIIIESFLENGKQNEKGTVFGKSITDPCLGFCETKILLNELFQAL